jgi:septum formation protein
MKLLLASSSPRRRDLLSRLTTDFTVVPSRIDEQATGAPAEQAVELARAKAQAVERHGPAVILAADTIVVIDDSILGKPRDRAEAQTMLRRLSGREHSVLTGLYVWNTGTGEAREHCEETRVTFRPLDNAEIEAYLDGGEFHDKAGAYAIQGAAAVFISGIHGDYTNVMGLPLCRTTLLLREVGVRL